MRFGRIPVAEAEGAILGHGVRAGGIRYRKGHVLSADDVDALADAGVAEIVAARLEPGDVAEDEAARRIAAAAAGEGIGLATAFTGRCNLHAEVSGVALVDPARVDAVNLADEALTIATVPPYEVVEPGQLVATVKVIPFAAPATAVDRCVAAARDDGPLISVAPFADRPVGLVLTETPGLEPKLLEKTVETVTARLERLGSHLARTVRCDHHERAVAAAIAELLAARCAPVLVFGASAIVDRRDVVPAGIELAGGTVEHFGMPVDPGNLLLLARHGEVPVIGVPGCARSPKPNGFDWVLQRLLAGVPVGRADIVRMGGGGLLKEIPSRPQPRERSDRAASAPRRPRIAALVLAAGQSRRMGDANKLLVEIDGIAMVARVVDAALASRARPVVVVTGHEADRVRAVLAGRDVRFVDNPDYARGLSTSLKRGLGALDPDLDGAAICLGDMPRVRAAHLDRLIAAFDPAEGRAVCVPTYAGKRGNPVVWAARFFPQIRSVAGDVGARHLIGENEEWVCEVPVEDDSVLADIDTPDALIELAVSGKARE